MKKQKNNTSRPITNTRGIEIKPLLPWMIAFAAVAVLQMLFSRVLNGDAAYILKFIMDTALWLLTAQLIGLLFNQVMRLRFVNYALMLAYLIYAVRQAASYISYIKDNALMHKYISLYKTEIVILAVLTAADAVMLIVTAISQFRKPKWRKKT